jgi:hypothetical protein
MNRRVLAVLCIAAGVPSAAALSTTSATAATLTPTAACYLAGTPVSIQGAGFTAGDEIALAGEGFFAAASTEATGSFTATQPTGVILPTIYPTASPFTITATDETTGQPVASTTIAVANLALQTSGGSKRPRAKRKWTVSGFFQEPGKPLYAHFLHAGRVYGNMKLGVPTGVCGQLSAERPGIKAARIPAGAWKVQIDFDPRFSKSSQPQVTGSTFVFKTFH